MGALYTISVKYYHDQLPTDALKDKMLNELDDAIQKAVATVAIRHNMYLDIS